MRFFAITLILAITSALAAQKPMPKAVTDVNLDKFDGSWRLISRLPNPVDGPLTNVVINYTRKGEKKIKETLTGTTKKGKQRTIKSTLTYKGNGIIKGPLGGKYMVVVLDDNYEYFVMATKNYVWINSRTKTMDNNTYNMIVSKVKSMGYDVLKLEMMKQE